MHYPWKDRWDDSKKLKGPLIVPIEQVEADPAFVDRRTVKHYLSRPSTQDWYFEPITCVKVGDMFYAAGDYAPSMVEACRLLGYADLQIVYIEQEKLK
jgi:hypothetical protein